MKDYFKKTEQIIDDSLTSIDVNEFERLVIECEETLRDGKKNVVSLQKFLWKACVFI